MSAAWGYDVPVYYFEVAWGGFDDPNAGLPTVDATARVSTAVALFPRIAVTVADAILCLRFASAIKTQRGDTESDGTLDLDVEDTATIRLEIEDEACR